MVIFLRGETLSREILCLYIRLLQKNQLDSFLFQRESLRKLTLRNVTFSPTPIHSRPFMKILIARHTFLLLRYFRKNVCGHIRIIKNKYITILLFYIYFKMTLFQRIFDDYSFKLLMFTSDLQQSIQKSCKHQWESTRNLSIKQTNWYFIYVRSVRSLFSLV